MNSWGHALRVLFTVEGRMKYLSVLKRIAVADPLSPATRATKRNLLIASVLGISANAFNITVDKIPLAGLSINFDDRLFAFLLVIALVYFLGTFVLYYIIDIKNLEVTKHQTAFEDRYTTRINPSILSM